MGNLLCCAGGFCCMALSSFQPVPNSTLKASYFGFVLLTLLLSLLFLYVPEYSSDWLSFVTGCKHYLVSCSDDCGTRLTTLLWLSFAGLSIIQVLLVLLFRGLFIGSLWLPDTAVVSVRQNWFVWISDFAYLGFYLFQSIAVIIQVYAINDYWVAKEQETFHLIGSTVVCWLSTFGLFAAGLCMYRDLGCPFTVLLYCTLGQAVLISVLSQLPWFEKGSLLTSGAVGTYLTYLCLNFLRHADGASEAQPSWWVFVTTIIEMALAAIILTVTSSTWSLQTPQTELSKPLVDPAEEKKIEKPKEEVVENSHEMFVFHLVLALTGFFFCTALRTLTNVTGSDSQVLLWGKVSIQGLTSLLFIWTFLAPAIFPDREFD